MKKVFLFFLITILFIVSCNRANKKQLSDTITYDVQEKTIEFNCWINNNSKEKYFLFCFKGYPWIEENSIFVSSSTLRELQTKIALIDWQLWDKIYIKNLSPKLKIELLINNRWEPIEKLIEFKNFDTIQTTFWGNPAYDNSVLERNYKTSVCNSCEILTLEKSVILANKKILTYKFLKLFPNELKARIRFL